MRLHFLLFVFLLPFSSRATVCGDRAKSYLRIRDEIGRVSAEIGRLEELARSEDRRLNEEWKPQIEEAEGTVNQLQAAYTAVDQARRGAVEIMPTIEQMMKNDAILAVLSDRLARQLKAYPGERLSAHLAELAKAERDPALVRSLLDLSENVRRREETDGEWLQMESNLLKELTEPSTGPLAALLQSLSRFTESTQRNMEGLRQSLKSWTSKRQFLYSHRAASVEAARDAREAVKQLRARLPGLNDAMEGAKSQSDRCGGEDRGGLFVRPT